VALTASAAAKSTGKKTQKKVFASFIPIFVF
jgi:hypothetical protein